MSEYMGDLTGVLGASKTNREPVHNKRKTSVDMDMTDFLTLMVAQLQNQSIDETADTSQMLNQLVQMQMITALTNMTEASVMSYASSLVGKEVTVVTYDGSKAQEKIIEVMGTGTYGGEQVIFSKEGDMYYLNEVMAVGRMPEPKTEESGDKPAEGTTPPETTDKPVEGAGEGEAAGTTPADKPVEGVEEGEAAGEVSDDKPVEGAEEGEAAGETPADRPVESTEEGEEAEPTQDEESGVGKAEAIGGAAEGED